MKRIMVTFHYNSALGDIFIDDNDDTRVFDIRQHTILRNKMDCYMHPFISRCYINRYV